MGKKLNLIIVFCMLFAAIANVLLYIAGYCMGYKNNRNKD